jgi:hypothetical protein
MPKAGTYSYPINDIDSVIAKLRRLYDVVKNDIIDRGNAADSLGMALHGGAFANLISDMEKYGLVLTGAGNVTITDAGKLALFGTPTEAEKIKSDAVTKIDLFREIYQTYGMTPTSEQIKAFLRQKATPDPSEAQKIAPKVDTIYKKVSKYIVSAESPQAAPTPLSEGGSGRREITKTESKSQPLKVQFGDVYIQVPADANSLESIKLAIDTLEFMKQRLLKEQQKKEASQENS